jgi:chemotaxis methyl-accepting protein methylase
LICFRDRGKPFFSGRLSGAWFFVCKMIPDLDISHICFAGSPSVASRTQGGLAPQLFHGHRGGTANCSKPDEEQIVLSILASAGLDPFAYGRDSLLRRLPACMRALKVKSPADCRSLLSHRTDLVSVAVSSLLIGVTQFFRDADVFDALRALVLPELRASVHSPLRIWSIGCSNGAEIYSVAILLAEHGLLERCVLLGTDCRTDAVEQASRGEYREASEMPPDIRRRYF